MNKFKKEYLGENYFGIGNSRIFKCENDVLNTEFLDKVKYPIMAFDTEFLNRSHSRNMPKNSPLFIKNSPAFKGDTVYVIQYAVISSKEEFLNGEYQKNIKCLKLERFLSNFSFESQYKKLRLDFLSICIEKNINSFFCSGGSSDFRLLKKWILDFIDQDDIKHLPFVKSYKNDELELDCFDVYSILEKVFLFENKDKIGQEYLDLTKLNRNMRDKEMVKFSSFAKLFEWAADDWEFDFRNEKGYLIYDLCTNIFPFYSYISTYKFSEKEYTNFMEILNITIDHCWNDVYKILIFIDFCYSFQEWYQIN